jgi:hypothetical protein
MLRGLIRIASTAIYYSIIIGMWPLNFLLSIVRKGVVYPNSVLHVSYMVHIPFYSVMILRRAGVRAEYLAIGESGVTWSESDFQLVPSRWPHIRAIKEFMFLWRILAKYEVIHSHFMITLSRCGWELKFLKRMGRRIVVHYRGCEIRDRSLNMSLHPELNICQECDYSAYCVSEESEKRRRVARRYGDAFLVTTPDLKEFIPEAIHVPFFTPEISLKSNDESRRKKERGITVLHVTNHPGIEGTKEIQKVIEKLVEEGYGINFVYLKGLSHERVLRELSLADLSIGKMKMGYYANFQIESLLLGVPAITYIRPEFMNEALEGSGFILTDLDGLENTLKEYLDNPWKLEEKKRIARESILRVHDNVQIAKQLITIYERIKLLPSRSMGHWPF